MTREEAKKEIEKVFEPAFANYIVEALTKGATVSEKEPTTKNDLGVDLVSRADVLKLMQDNWHTHNGDWAMQESIDDIRVLPSVIPQEPRKGHWTDNGYCSECGCDVPAYIDDWKWKKNMDAKFCPNCGAKMDKGANNE